MGPRHLPGIHSSAAATCGRLPGPLAVQRLAELAPRLVPGGLRLEVLVMLRLEVVMLRLRPGVSHADLLLSAGCSPSFAQPGPGQYRRLTPAIERRWMPQVTDGLPARQLGGGHHALAAAAVNADLEHDADPSGQPGIFSLRL